MRTLPSKIDHLPEDTVPVSGRVGTEFTSSRSAAQAPSTPRATEIGGLCQPYSPLNPGNLACMICGTRWAHIKDLLTKSLPDLLGTEAT